MNTKIFYLFILLPVLGSCQTNVKLASHDIVVTRRLFSPNKSYVALTFYKDNGAMGESSPMTSLLKTEDTIGLLNEYFLPCFDLPLYACCYPDKWLDNKTLQVFLNERPFVKGGIPFPSSPIMHNGVRLKVVPYDYSYQHSPLIEHFSLSPDKKKLMVAYRYKGPSELNISVMNYPEPLPRIGNIFTNTEISWNPVVFGKWDGEGIDLFLPDAKEYKLSDYLNEGVRLPVRFVDVTEYTGSLGDRQYWTNSKLYENSFVDEILKNKGKETLARIVEVQWQSDEKEKSLFRYEYEYIVEGRTYRSYFRIAKPIEKGQDYEKGDSLPIVFDSVQPIIHHTKQNYGR